MSSADSATLRRPPCIVLGVESPIGLNIVRELGRAGVRVIGVAQAANAIGLASRYLHEAVVIERFRTAEAIARLNALARTYGDCVLLVVSEVNIAWYQAHAASLEGVRLIAPPPSALEIALDKQRTLVAAQRVGIPVPTSYAPSSIAECEALTPQLKFPIVLKWKDPSLIQARLEASGIAFQKSEYIFDADQWRAATQRYAPIAQWPLVQNYCPGHGVGQFFFMHNGEVLRRFQHHRVAEWPPEGGFSSICDALPPDALPELQEKSIALLRQIGWEGVAMVEYRHDFQTGDTALMEINGRFWGSFPLAVHAGAGFALLAYFTQGLGEIPPLPALNTRLRCRMVVTELKRLARICLQPGKIQDPLFQKRPAAEILRFVANYFRPGVRYFVWTWDDPHPFFRDLGNMLGSLASATLGLVFKRRA